MKAVLQRVDNCKIEIEEVIYSETKMGFLVLLGIENSDSTEDADYLVRKISTLRVFSDEAGKMNKNIQEIYGEIMVVSQFTLFANTRKGNRPSFLKAAKPDIAIPLYEYFISQMEDLTELKVRSGKFGADMKVHLTNNGPVTIFINSRKENNDP